MSANSSNIPWAVVKCAAASTLVVALLTVLASAIFDAGARPMVMLALTPVAAVASIAVDYRWFWFPLGLAGLLTCVCLLFKMGENPDYARLHRVMVRRCAWSMAALLMFGGLANLVYSASLRAPDKGGSRTYCFPAT